jgi:formylmethanofuran dehydrogenase subunit E
VPLNTVYGRNGIRKDYILQYEDIIDFHGHSCPGLAVGYRLAVAAMDALDVVRSDDEELIAVVESDACGVDALQCVSGCTFGKGNLIFRDYGKHAYSLFSRVKQQGVRVVFHGKGIPAELREDRPRYAARIITEQQDAILSVIRIPYEELQGARVRKSVECSRCGENVMESRVRETVNGPICIPCAERAES